MVQNLFDLTGKVCLVTGANSGLGLGFATGLAKAGADVIIWGRREDRNREAEAELRSFGGKVASRSVDVSDPTAVAAGMDALLDEFGRLDVLVANAGMASVAPIEQMTDDIWHGLLAVNLHGVFYTCREAARHMKDRSARGDRGGSIILNGSLAVFSGVPGLHHYAASKGGLNSMSKSLAVELGAHDIRVNVICPGYIATDVGQNDSGARDHMIKMTLARTPIQRIAEPDALEGVVVYLAGDRSWYHSGDTITLDGGMMAQTY